METRTAGMAGWGRRVLILGDTDFHRVLLGYLLETRGLKVTTVRTAEEAIAVLRQELYGFDIFILNLCLPGLDHIKIFEHFKEEASKIRFPIYAIKRVFTSPAEEADLKSFGISDFIDKSLTPEEIVFRLGRHLFAGLLERRRSARIPVFLPADYRVAETRSSGYVADLSSEGLFFQLLEAQASWVDLAIEMSFCLPPARTVHAVKGKIRHAKPGVGLGIHFFQVPAEQQEEIDDFIRWQLI